MHKSSRLSRKVKGLSKYEHILIDNLFFSSFSVYAKMMNLRRMIKIVGQEAISVNTHNHQFQQVLVLKNTIPKCHMKIQIHYESQN